MQKLLKGLEDIKPLKVYKIGSATFRIYKAKDLYHPFWNSETLKRITKFARQSYLRYGDVPTIDNYDNNAAVYLCRTTYENMEEWLCLRFVPGDTRDHSLEDVDQYLYNGRSIAGTLKKKLVLKNNPIKKSVAVSRLCGIPPYTVKFTAQQDILSRSMKYTAQAFGLINKEFFSEKHFSYLVGVFRPEVSKKLLKFSPGLNLSFPDAYEILKCKPDQIYLDRKSLAYHFPGYFLNIEQLVELLQKLIEENKLKIEFIKKYAKKLLSGKKFKDYKEILKNISGISKVLLWKGKIPQSKLNGNELRSLVDKSVDDGPRLKIVTVASWVDQLDRIKVHPIKYPHSSEVAAQAAFNRVKKINF